MFPYFLQSLGFRTNGDDIQFGFNHLTKTVAHGQNEEKYAKNQNEYADPYQHIAAQFMCTMVE